MKKRVGVLIMLISGMLLSTSGCGVVKEKVEQAVDGVSDLVESVKDIVTPGNNTVPDEWISATLENSEGKKLKTLLPPDLAENRVSQDNKWTTICGTSHYTFAMSATLLTDGELEGTGWANQKPDSDFDGTVADALFDMMCEDMDYNTQELFSQMNVTPICEKKKEIIYQTDWKSYSLSGSTKENGGISVTAKGYLYVDDSTTVVVTFMSSYSPNEASKDEIQMLDDWIKLIPTTFELENP